MPRHVPRKRFGQHFLIDESVIEAIVAAIRPQADDRMVEIGPGLGALTGPLLRHVRQLHAVEIDRDIVHRLERSYPRERLTIHQADALRFDFAALGPALRVVGNLPYNISTPLLFHLATSAHSIRDIHVMLQKEVVARMVSVPSTPEYGRLSVMLQHRFSMEQVATVPAAAFQPAPKVESAVVRMLPHRDATGPCDETSFAALVRSAFMHRRKTLRNALRAYFTEEDFSMLRIDPDARAQDLSVTDFEKASNYLARRAGRAACV